MKQLGFDGKITELVSPQDLEGFTLARVVVEHRERYVVQTMEQTYSAEITGNLRFAAASRRDFPAVGDWVKITPMDDESAIIFEVLPRTSVLERQAVGRQGEVQLIATNIDFAFLVQAVGHDFNLKRMERYLALCHNSGIQPIFLLTKADLATPEEIEDLTQQVKARVKDMPVYAVSSMSQAGLQELEGVWQPYATYCFLGSSGVGKSTLVNHLMGQAVQKTSAISDSTSKGRHTTSHRELIVLPNGSIVIDTPGMREVGMAESKAGIEHTYDDIAQLAEDCRFSDCTHTTETGCAVLQALEDGDLDESAYENYQKLMREQEHFTSTIAERRQKSRAQGKLYRSVKKERNQKKF